MIEQVKSQGITAVIWEGIRKPSVKESINLAHKEIVKYARLAEWESVTIGEDDIVFTKPYSWDYYVVHEPKDYDLYLGMIYLGDIIDGQVKDFTGLTLYTVAQRFYDTFLDTPDDDHIDRLLANLGTYKVCDPFVVKQLNGWSSNTGKMENYDELLRNRTFL